jgi:hypothetical protein
LNVKSREASFREVGIEKRHLFLFYRNTVGKAFWNKIGWTPRTDIQVVSKEL